MIERSLPAHRSLDSREMIMPTKKYRHWTAAQRPSVRVARLLDYPAKLKKVVGDPRVRTGSFYVDLRSLADRYGYAGDLTASEFRVFSQNGEDGVIAEIIRRIGPQCPRTFVEFGAAKGRAGNCVFLADALGWDGLFIEPATHDFAVLEERYRYSSRVRTVCEFVRPDNLDELVAASGLTTLGVMSIDVDGNDFYIWEALRIRPAVVIVEYNGSIPLNKVAVQPLSDDPWDGTNYYGCSLEALKVLAKRKRYRFVHTELTGTNAFFVADEFQDAFADIQEVPERKMNAELLGITHPRDPLERHYRNDI
jgi:hypothetical protein